MTSKTDNLDPACSEIRERIPLFIGGDLDLEVLDSVSEHLQKCPACQQAMDAAKRGREALVATLRQREPDYREPGLWAGVRAGLLESGVLGDVPSSEVKNTELTPSVSPALPSLSERRQPVLVGSEDDTPGLHALGSGDERGGRSWLRRASAWVPLAAAACALYFMGPFGGSSEPQPDNGPVPSIAPPLASGPSAGDREIGTLPAPPANLAAGTGNTIPDVSLVGHQPLRKLEKGEVRLLQQWWLRQGQEIPVQPQSSGAQLATFEDYQ